MKKLAKKAKRMVDLLLEDGSEKVSSKPAVAKVPTRQPLTIQQQVRQIVDQHIAAAAQEQGFETPEEADDFEIGEDYDPESPYEYNFDPSIVPESGDFVEEIPHGKDTTNTGDTESNDGNSGENDNVSQEEKSE